MTCPFCHIPENEKHRMLFEGKTTVAFLANPRMMPGHTLVIPKRHEKKLSKLKEKERKELLETIIRFEEKIPPAAI